MQEQILQAPPKMILHDHLDRGWSDLSWLSINAMKSAFYPFDDRLGLINGVIKPGFAALAAESAFRVSATVR